MIILTVPELNEDRRKEYVKMAKSYGEDAKVALRNIRQEDNEAVKQAKLPEDEEKLYLEDIQDSINKYNKIVDDKVKEKEEELMRI